VVASGSASLSPRAAIFRHRFSPIILLTTERAPTRRIDPLKSLVDAVHVCGEREIDFSEGLRWLWAEWGVHRLLGEGGAQLNDGLFRARVVDELHLTLTPMVFGGHDSPSMADGLGLSKLSDAAQFRLRSVRRHGDELHLVYRCLAQGVCHDPVSPATPDST
jgi:riboflavin-specific deaminase-like protein